GIHRRHGLGGHEPAALPGARRGGTCVSGEQGRHAYAHGRPGVRGKQSDRGEYHGRGARAESAGGAPPITLDAHNAQTPRRAGARMRGFGVLAILVMLPAANLAAQHAGQFEAGAFGGYTRYDAALGLANKLGGGGRLGYFFGDAVGLEADVLFQPQYTVAPSGTPTTLQPLIGSASLVFNAIHASRLMLYVLGGYSLLDFGTRAPYRFTDNAVHGGAGARIFLTPRVALRVEGRGVYVPSTKYAVGSTTATHVVVTAGLSVFHLGGPPQDSDKDGVPDKKDACPNTPLGATVDARGCPTDPDTDGVSDGLDKCPNTPAGALVDAKGCPMDSDLAGVPDGLDKCPNTPAGTPVDTAGCPLPRQLIRDSDGDGVPDDRDKCPNTPAGSKVDANGC